MTEYRHLQVHPNLHRRSKDLLHSAKNSTTRMDVGRSLQWPEPPAGTDTAVLHLGLIWNNANRLKVPFFHRSSDSTAGAVQKDITLFGDLSTTACQKWGKVYLYLITCNGLPLYSTFGPDWLRTNPHVTVYLSTDQTSGADPGDWIMEREYTGPDSEVESTVHAWNTFLDPRKSSLFTEILDADHYPDPEDLTDGIIDDDGIINTINISGINDHFINLVDLTGKFISVDDDGDTMVVKDTTITYGLNTIIGRGGGIFGACTSRPIRFENVRVTSDQDNNDANISLMNTAGLLFGTALHDVEVKNCTFKIDGAYRMFGGALVGTTFPRVEGVDITRVDGLVPPQYSTREGTTQFIALQTGDNQTFHLEMVNKGPTDLNVRITLPTKSQLTLTVGGTVPENTDPVKVSPDQTISISIRKDDLDGLDTTDKALVISVDRNCTYDDETAMVVVDTDSGLSIGNMEGFYQDPVTIPYHRGKRAISTKVTIVNPQESIIHTGITFPNDYNDYYNELNNVHNTLHIHSAIPYLRYDVKVEDDHTTGNSGNWNSFTHKYDDSIDVTFGFVNDDDISPNAGEGVVLIPASNDAIAGSTWNIEGYTYVRFEADAAGTRDVPDFGSLAELRTAQFFGGSISKLALSKSDISISSQLPTPDGIELDLTDAIKEKLNFPVDTELDIKQLTIFSGISDTIHVKLEEESTRAYYTPLDKGAQTVQIYGTDGAITDEFTVEQVGGTMFQLTRLLGENVSSATVVELGTNNVSGTSHVEVVGSGGNQKSLQFTWDSVEMHFVSPPLPVLVAEGGGDPYIFPLIGPSMKLPNVEETYRLYESPTVVINGTVQRASTQIQQEIHAVVGGGDDFLSPLDTEAHFFSHLLVAVGGEYIQLDLEQRSVSGNYGHVLHVEGPVLSHESLQFDTFSRKQVSTCIRWGRDTCLTVYYTANPQVRNGLRLSGSQLLTSDACTGLLVKNFRPKLFRLHQGLQDVTTRLQPKLSNYRRTTTNRGLNGFQERSVQVLSI